MSFFITKHICYFLNSTYFISSLIYTFARGMSILILSFFKNNSVKTNITSLLSVFNDKKGTADNSTVPFSHIPTFQISIPILTKISLFNRLFLKLAISTSKHKILVLSRNWANTTSVFLIFLLHTPHGSS